MGSRSEDAPAFRSRWQPSGKTRLILYVVFIVAHARLDNGLFGIFYAQFFYNVSHMELDGAY